jgi:hypothetical protein
MKTLSYLQKSPPLSLMGTNDVKNYQRQHSSFKSPNSRILSPHYFSHHTFSHFDINRKGTRYLELFSPFDIISKKYPPLGVHPKKYTMKTQDATYSP